MDTTEEDCLEKRSAPSFDVYQSCCSCSICVLPFFKQLDCFWKVLLAGAGLSFVIEMIQLLFPGSVTDIDDLILNAAGVAIGYGIYKLVCRSRGKV